MGHNEYWRLYQSAQFVHLFSVREASEPAWRQKLEAAAQSHLRHYREIDWRQVPGFVSIVNFVYCMTEIYEFAARLCQRGIYEGSLTILVELKRIQGFVLMADFDRAWFNYHAAAEDVLSRHDNVPTDTLVAEAADRSLTSVAWFFERFGWLDPLLEVLKADQHAFLRKRG